MQCGYGALRARPVEVEDDEAEEDPIAEMIEQALSGMAPVFRHDELAYTIRSAGQDAPSGVVVTKIGKGAGSGLR